MGDTGTTAILTRYEYMWLRSFRQNERTTARVTLQYKRGDCSCCRAVTAGHQHRLLPNLWKASYTISASTSVDPSSYSSVATTLYPTLVYLLIKYIKSVLWRVVKCLSYIEDARCLKVNVAGTQTTLHFWFQAFAMFWMLCTFFWVIPRHLNSRRRGITQKKAYNYTFIMIL